MVISAPQWGLYIFSVAQVKVRVCMHVCVCPLAGYMFILGQSAVWFVCVCVFSVCTRGSCVFATSSTSGISWVLRKPRAGSSHWATSQSCCPPEWKDRCQFFILRTGATYFKIHIAFFLIKNYFIYSALIGNARALHPNRRRQFSKYIDNVLWDLMWNFLKYKYAECVCVCVCVATDKLEACYIDLEFLQTILPQTNSHRRY